MFNNTLNVSEMMANRDEQWLRLAISMNENVDWIDLDDFDDGWTIRGLMMTARIGNY